MRVQKTVSVPANSSVSDILNGTQYQFAPVSGIAEFLATGSATGLNLNITIGTETVVENSAVNASNRVPQKFNDEIGTDIEISAGEQVIASFTNTTAGALTAFFTYEIAEVDETIGLA